jgi:DNA-binding response OmpR family regulator
MPEVSVLQILSTLQANAVSCVLLMLTGNGTKRSVIRAIGLGATDFITKPCYVNNLLER